MTKSISATVRTPKFIIRQIIAEDCEDVLRPSKQLILLQQKQGTGGHVVIVIELFKSFSL
jgi:hypothetical protein